MQHPTARSQPDPIRESRALITLTILTGTAAIVAYPAAVLEPLATALFLAMPIALATSGRLLERRWIEALAAIVALLLLIGFAGIVPGLGPMVALGGPMLVVVAVATALRRSDRFGAGIWVLAAAISLMAGTVMIYPFPNATMGLVLILATIQVTYPLVRLRRMWRSPERR